MKKSLCGVLHAGLALVMAASAAVHADPVKACFVYVSPLSEFGFTHQHDEGRKEMEANMKGAVVTSYVDNVPEGADAERVIREMAMSGCKVIFGTSFGYMNAMEKAARQFPNVVFAHATGYKSNSTNFSNYNARFYQGRYVAGMAGGGASKKNIIGYIAAVPIPEVLQGINALTLGARSINPNIKVRVIWTNSWYDPGKEREAALTLIAQGADVLTNHTDSIAVPQVAEEKGVHLLAYHTDASKIAPKVQLTSAIHEWGNYYTQMMKSVLAGTWKPTNHWGGFGDGMVRVAPFARAVPEAVRSKANKVIADMKSGRWDPFTGPIHKQDGTLVAGPGVRLSDAEIGTMNYYVAGVEGSLPTNK